MSGTTGPVAAGLDDAAVAPGGLAGGTASAAGAADASVAAIVAGDDDEPPEDAAVALDGSVVLDPWLPPQPADASALTRSKARDRVDGTMDLEGRWFGAIMAAEHTLFANGRITRGRAMPPPAAARTARTRTRQS